MDANTARGGWIAVVDNDQYPDRLPVEELAAVGWRLDRYLSGAAFAAAFDPLRYDCLILELMLTDGNGVDLLDSLRTKGHRTPAILVSAFCDIPATVRALRLGAVEVMKRPVSVPPLVEAVRLAAERAGRLRREEARAGAAARRLATLTEREGEVLELVLEGVTSREIAERLGIATRTVEAHRARLMHKMEAGSSVELIYEYLLATHADPVDLLTGIAAGHSARPL